ncbi:unnamed protein product [Cylicocyclus nassatus]|uniref:Uncharacterized protein n=1 Tax=Cylicocyclus nassatus TaxID=53992 RepID=A0AA36GQV7_CYLNA|nr:unnamed protein product [Cylicocyclus nassatus]
MTEIIKEIAKEMATKIAIVKMNKNDEEWKGNIRKFPIFSEWKGMEQTLKVMGIEFEYEFDDNLEITAVIVNGFKQETTRWYVGDLKQEKKQKKMQRNLKEEGRKDMARHIVDIALNDEEERLIKYLAKKDGITVKEELRSLLNLQIWEESENYMNEVEEDD